MIWMELRCAGLIVPGCWSAENAGPMRAAFPDNLVGVRSTYKDLIKDAKDLGWERIKDGDGDLEWHCPNCVKLRRQAQGANNEDAQAT